MAEGVSLLEGDYCTPQHLTDINLFHNGMTQRVVVTLYRWTDLDTGIGEGRCEQYSSLDDPTSPKNIILSQYSCNATITLQKHQLK